MKKKNFVSGFLIPVLLAAGNRRRYCVWLSSCLLLLSSSAYAVNFGDGGAALEGVLDSITVAPNPGNTSTDVNADSLDDNLDSYWRMNGGSSVMNVIAGNSSYSFGIFDAANPANRVPLFSGSDPQGAIKTVNILADGSVRVNSVDTGINFSENLFGFYIELNASTWFSDTSLNNDSLDHMTSYQGQGVDRIQIGLFAPGQWLTNEYIFGWEDGNDADFDDFVIIIESIDPQPFVPPQPVSLGDRVWEDLNADGIQDCEDTNGNGIIGDAGDMGDECATGLVGVGVTLLNNCNTTPEFVAMASTDSNGFYQFPNALYPNLDPGEYCVKFDKPSADVALNCDTEIGGSSMFSPANQGGDDGIDSDANPVTGVTSPTTLDPGETDLTVDAGLYCPAKLGDRVWNDLNRDGIQDGGESGINGVKAELFVCDINGDPTGGPVAMRMTDTMNLENGIYMFNPLMPGSYAVKFSDLPAGFVFSPANEGLDDALDSDADTASGFTMCMPLESNQNDPTKDAGLNQPPAGLGDRLWEDKDGDGIQKAGEDGIPGATVNLLTPGPDGQCDTVDDAFAGMTTTVGDGFYEFLDLIPGRYCVEFDISTVDICTLGAPSFTERNIGDDAMDSDANPTTGRTGNIDLGANQYDSSNDAGIVCPAKLGDRVWKDDDLDGIQEASEDGVNGVVAQLYACDANDNPINGPIDDTTTSLMGGENGIYMFFDLAPGNYAVRFINPPSLAFTLPNEGSDDGGDSDANPGSGFTDCMPLESNENNPTKDAGLVDPPECGIGLVKTCAVIVPPAPPLEQCSQKLNSFTLIWNGSGQINISGIANDAPGGNVSPGDVVTFPGPFAQNDNVLLISGAASGESKFHISCSDFEMDGETDNATFPNDCGRPEGNGKSNESGLINDWLLEGLSDGSGQVVNCTTDPQPSTSSCEFNATTASCDTLPVKPTMLSFLYTGGGCSASDNSQGSKTSCSGATDSSQAVSITTSAGENFNVTPGGSFTITKDGSNTVISLSNSGGTETSDVHTSCSAPLITGEVFGSLTLTALDGVGSGKDVLYSYLVENLGSSFIGDISVTDDKLGLIGSGLSLNPGDSETLSALGFISETTTNIATATGVGIPGAQCIATSSVTVTVLPPPPPPPCSAIASFKEFKKDETIKYEVTNTSNRVATLDSLMLDFPGAFDAIKEVKLDGAIYKASDSSSLPIGPGETIGSLDWTQSDVAKRQLDPGEKRTLEIKFSVKSTGFDQNDFSGAVTFEEGCMVLL